MARRSAAASDLVSVCDIAIAPTETQFSLSEVRLGIVPACIGPFVVAKIGASHARGLVHERRALRRREGPGNRPCSRSRGRCRGLWTPPVERCWAICFNAGPTPWPSPKELVLDLSWPERRSQFHDTARVRVARCSPISVFRPKDKKACAPFSKNVNPTGLSRNEEDQSFVANRSEIACRIFQTCREMGLETVAICAPGDEEARHLTYADEVHAGDILSRYLRRWSRPRRTRARADSSGLWFFVRAPRFRGRGRKGRASLLSARELRRWRRWAARSPPRKSRPRQASRLCPGRASTAGEGSRAKRPRKWVFRCCSKHRRAAAARACVGWTANRGSAAGRRERFRRSACGIWRRDVVSGAPGGSAPSYRSAGFRRRARQWDPSSRARMLASAPASESLGRGDRAASARSDAPGAVRRRAPAAQGREVSQRRNARVSRRPSRAIFIFSR